MTSNMSAGERRKIIDHIVEAHTGLTYPNWWGPLDDPAVVHKEVAIAYREWATARAPTLRAELEALPESVLIAEKESCNQRPEWFAVSSLLYEELERQQELERLRQYHRSIAQKGGQTHRSTAGNRRSVPGHVRSESKGFSAEGLRETERQRARNARRASYPIPQKADRTRNFPDPIFS